MIKILKNVKTLRDDGKQFVLDSGDIVVNSGKVVSADIFHENIEEIDMEGRLIFSPFFNIHGHLGESIFKDISGSEWTLSKYLSYTEEFNGKLQKSERDELWEKSATFTVSEMEKTGITGFCAARSASTANLYSMNTMAGYPIMNSQKLIDFKKAGIKGFLNYQSEHRGEKVSIGVFLHSVYSNDADSLELARTCLREGAEFITVHVSEDYESTQNERKTYGMSAIQVLEKYGLLTDRTILVHCGFMSDDDYQIVKDTKAAVAVCPLSNVFLNTRMVNIYKLLDYGIPWCIATDGLGTGRTFSMIDQVHAAKSIFKDVPYESFFRSITTIPARYFNRKIYSGRIEPGTEAKFLVAECHEYDQNTFLGALFEGRIDYRLEYY